MKVAVSSAGKDLNSQLDPRFGRCRYFIIIETDDMSFNVFENKNAGLPNGAGIQSASFIASQGVKALLTGNCGPKAEAAIAATDIEICLVQVKTVLEAVEKFKKEIETSPNISTAAKKFNTAGQNMSGNPAFGRKMGMGCGKGMGRGGGRGMGRGMGQGGISLLQQTIQESSTMSKTQELELLKKQSEDLKNQLQNIELKIKSLE